jgi:hypothetical protein
VFRSNIKGEFAFKWFIQEVSNGTWFLEMQDREEIQKLDHLFFFFFFYKYNNQTNTKEIGVKYRETRNNRLIQGK